MERLIQLNLPREGQKAEAESVPNSERKEPAAFGKRLNRIVNKAAHKAAMEFGRSKSGIFSK